MRADNESLVDLEELVSMLQQHEGPPQARERAAGAAGRRVARRPRTLRLRWGLAGAAVALLAGSGLGFGLAGSVTPTSEAGTPFSGFGFLPLRDWNVVQTGALGRSGAAHAIAANVTLHPQDSLGAAPARTIASLPRDGVVVHAIFTTRGNPGEDFRFQQRALPLRIADAIPMSPASDSLLSIGQSAQRLTAGVRGHNVDVRIYYGRVTPTAAMTTSAQRQLERLVVAAERVTIFARPTTVGRVGQATTTLYGSIDSGRAGEQVDIQAKDCGQQFYRGVAGATTRSGGEWTVEYTPGITTSLRAIWNDQASAPVVVRAQAGVSIRRHRGGGFEVGITARAQFWRRPVLIQQRSKGSWKTVKTALITESAGGPAGYGGGYIYNEALFKLKVPRGTMLRAVLPKKAAAPCYLASISDPFRV